MILRYIISTFFLSALLTTAHATNGAANLASLLNSVTTMRADFTQTIFDNRGKAVQKSYGRMALQRPGRFRWEVTKPIPQLIIANATRLWIYDADLEQVTIRPLKTTAGEAPALLLSHSNTTLDKDFSVTEIPNKADGWRWFTLVPQHTDEMFTSIKIGFKNNQISEMRLQDNLGHTTGIQYKNIATNASLPASLFTFTPPPHTDVIDETRKK